MNDTKKKKSSKLKMSILMNDTRKISSKLKFSEEV